MKKNIFLTFAFISASLLSSHIFGTDAVTEDKEKVVAEEKEVTLTTVAEQLTAMSAKLDELQKIKEQFKSTEEQLTEKTKSETQLNLELAEVKKELANKEATILKSLRDLAKNIITDVAQEQVNLAKNLIKNQLSEIPDKKTAN